MYFPSLLSLLCFHSVSSPSVDAVLQHSCPLEEMVPQDLLWGAKSAESQQRELWGWVSSHPRAKTARDRSRRSHAIEQPPRAFAKLCSARVTELCPCRRCDAHPARTASSPSPVCLRGAAGGWLASGRASKTAHPPTSVLPASSHAAGQDLPQAWGSPTGCSRSGEHPPNTSAGCKEQPRNHGPTTSRGAGFRCWHEQNCTCEGVEPGVSGHRHRTSALSISEAYWDQCLCPCVSLKPVTTPQVPAASWERWSRAGCLQKRLKL